MVKTQNNRRIFIAGLDGRICTNLFFATLKIVNGYLDRVPIVGVSSRGKKNLEKSANLLRLDMVLGHLPYDMTVEGREISESDSPDGRYGELWFHEKDSQVMYVVPVYDSSSPENLPLADLGVDVLLNATGKYMDLKGAELFLKAGAKKVILTGPPKNRVEIKEIIYAINGELDKGEKVISLASCTTNAVTPIVGALYMYLGKLPLGIAFNTTHAATNSQKILPSSSGSGSFNNVLSYKTGASQSLLHIVPDIERCEGHAWRTPIANGSVVDIYMVFDQEISTKQVTDALKEAIQGKYSEIIGIYDYGDTFETCKLLGNPHTAVVKFDREFVSGGWIVHVSSGYDNEYAYSYHAMLAAMRCPIPE